MICEFLFPLVENITILILYKSEFPYMYIDARWSLRLLAVMHDYSCDNSPFDTFYHSDKTATNTVKI